ncbi:hypothetical protein SFRURICE_019693, partial [Spodoptera frugiperda]
PVFRTSFLDSSVLECLLVFISNPIFSSYDPMLRTTGFTRASVHKAGEGTGCFLVIKSLILPLASPKAETLPQVIFFSCIVGAFTNIRVHTDHDIRTQNNNMWITQKVAPCGSQSNPLHIARQPVVRPTEHDYVKTTFLINKTFLRKTNNAKSNPLKRLYKALITSLTYIAITLTTGAKVTTEM